MHQMHNDLFVYYIIFTKIIDCLLHIAYCQLPLPIAFTKICYAAKGLATTKTQVLVDCRAAGGWGGCMDMPTHA